MPSVYGVFFEANSIQQYILAGGRLRDVVGASYLIDSLGREVLDAVCTQLGLTQGATTSTSGNGGSIHFPRRAAGAIYALFEEEQQATDFAALWSLVVRAHCPSLSFNQVMAKGDNDFAVLQEGATTMACARAYPVPSLPPATPITERAPRTGHAKITNTTIGVDKTPEAADAALASRRSVTAGAVEAMDDRLLRAKVELALHPELKLKVVFPRNLEFADAEDDPGASQRWQFPFNPDSRYLAVIHADGNGIGQIMLSVIAAASEAAVNPTKTNTADAYAEFLPRLSEAVEDCTTQAVQHAITTVLLPYGAEAVAGTVDTFWRLPARPIVIAGDDLSMIVRADLALAFTCHFICEFERLTKCKFDALRKAFPDLGRHLPSAGLTACAGIAFARNNQPFAMLHEVAENLCSEAKQQVKELARQATRAAAFGTNEQHTAGSAIVWRRITESLLGSEISTKLDDIVVLPRLGVLSVGSTNHGLPTVEALEALLAALQPSPVAEGATSDDRDNPLSKGPLRRILTTVFMQPRDASVDYLRWKKLAEGDGTASRGWTQASRQIEQFSKKLKELAESAHGVAWEKLPAIAWPTSSGTNEKPRPARLVLQELVDLLAVGHQSLAISATPPEKCTEPEETADD